MKPVDESGFSKDVLEFIQTVQKLPLGCKIRFKANGTSMLPIINNGDIVEMVKTSLCHAKRGDIVVSLCDGMILCHRLQKLKLNHKVELFQTQGDTLLPLEPLLPSECFLGIITKVFNSVQGVIDFQDSSVKLFNKLFLILPYFKRFIEFVLNFIGISSNTINKPGLLRIFFKSLYLMFCYTALFLLRILGFVKKGARNNL